MPRLILTLLAIVVGVGAWWLIQWRSTAATSVVTGEVTYLCTETREIVTGPAQPTPAVNPKTGRRTLVLAVKSPAGEWMPAPPDENHRRQRRIGSEN